MPAGSNYYVTADTDTDNDIRISGFHTMSIASFAADDDNDVKGPVG